MKTVDALHEVADERNAHARISARLHDLYLGVAQILRRLLSTAMPNKSEHELPCWWALTCGCRQQERDGNCPRCKLGTKPPAGMLKAVRANCKPAFIDKKIKGSPVDKAG